MELKNLIPFNSFKRITEASIPNDFSNNTGFKESLVGRAMFGILRYFKKGIDLGKLEYYKRKLENEYFAAILRFCASKNIDLKTGIDPSSKEDSGQSEESNNSSDNNNNGGNGSDQYEFEYCEVLSTDYSVGQSNTNGINQTKQTYQTYLSDLNQVMTILVDQVEKDECQKLIDNAENIIRCCNAKLSINVVFTRLLSLSGTTDPNVVTYLDQIKNFFESNDSKYCSTYKGTPNEQAIIKGFCTSTDQNIKAKADGIVPLLEKINYSYFDLIQEKITSGLNKSISITQMLGDQLNLSGKASQKVNIYEYLKKIGIENVDEINFVELVKLFRNNTEYQSLVSSDNYLNHAGIRKIQYAVSDGIIFHVEKTPDNVGINPGTGGGTKWKEDTSMRKVWEKKVEFVRSEFSGFFDFSKVDPFVLLNLNEAMREKDKYYKDSEVVNDKGNVKGLSNTLSLETHSAKLGLNPKGDNTMLSEKTPFVMTLINGDSVYYPVFTLCGTDSDRTKVYRYFGIINFDKILSTKEYEKPDFDSNANKFAKAVWDNNAKPDVDSKFLNILRLPGTLNGGTSDFDSVYVSNKDFTRIGSRINPTFNTQLRFLFNFVKKANNQSFGQFKGAKTTATANDFDLRCLIDGNNTLATVDMANVMNNTNDKLIQFRIGEIFEIIAGWEIKYFPDGGDQTVSKYKDIPYINKQPYNTSIILKP